MTFAAAGWLLLGGLLGLVILVLHASKRQVTEISSLELWRRLELSPAARRAFKPPKFSWPLVLQVLTVVLLTLALARPQARQLSGLSEHYILLFDSSSSMNARSGDTTRRELALTALKREIDKLPENGLISLLAVSPGVDIVAARLQDKAEVLALLAQLKPTDLVTEAQDWELAARQVAGLQLDETFSLVVFTDGTAEAVAQEALRRAFPASNLELQSFGDAVDNAAFAQATLTPLALEEGRWQLEGRVAIFSDQPKALELSLLFTPEGTEGALAWAKHELIPRGEEAFFSVELELPGAGLLELRLPDDGLAADNQQFFSLPSASQTAQILQLGPDNPPLTQALLALDSVELFRAERLPEDSSSYDLVILDRVSVEKHPGTHSLWLGGASPLGQLETPLKDPRPTHWDSAHPLARSLDWAELELSSAWAFPQLAGADTLVEASGQALIQARTTAAGREIVLAFDLSTSPWVEELGFPLFISHVLRWALPWHGQITGQRCVVGQACSLDVKTLYPEASLLPVDGSARLELPSGFVGRSAQAQPETVWLAPGFDHFYPQRTGAYMLEPSGSWLVVEAAAAADLRQAARTATSSTQERGSRWQIYRWLLLVTLFCYLAEALLARRGAGRLFSPAGLAGHPFALRQRFIFALRLLCLACLVLALLGVRFWQPYREGRVVVISERGPYAEDSQLRMEAVSAQLARQNGAWQRHYVHLGQQAQMTRSLEHEPPYLQSGANLASGLDLALGLLGTTRGRILLLARGAQTQDELVRQVGDGSTPVDVLPVGGLPEGEVLVDDLSLPAQLYQGDSFTLLGRVYSSSPTPAELRIWRNGELYQTRTLELQSGYTRFDVSLQEEKAGQMLYEVEVRAPRDVFVQNNRNALMADLKPKARVALVSAQANWGAVLTQALETQGLDVVRLEPPELPYFLDELLGYDGLILSNVAALELHSVQQEVLETWVRDYGGGLVILGGENSFGPGGYYQTALERISPLSSRVPQDAPKVAMVFVLDRSGSMQQKVGELSRLDIAKEASASAVDVLHPESLTGIVVFDTETTTLLPLQRADSAAMRKALGPLEPGGGTALYGALASAFEHLRASDASTRHIIVMTDGLSQPADFSGLSKRIADEAISVSTIAIGEGIDTRLLEHIARRGGGAFHATADVRALPSILSQEVMMLANEAVREVSFVPTWQERDAVFLANLSETLPPLHGYVQTSLKPEASLHLSGPEKTPLLASWRYGLGRVVAFASQGAGPWTKDWLQDASYPLLWSQAIRWALPPLAKPGLHLDLRPQGDALELRLYAVDPSGEAATGLNPSLRVSKDTSDSLETALKLSEIEPGLYYGSVPAETPGRYLLQLEAEGFEAITRSYQKAYLARYRFEQSAERLQGLAAATGGRVLIGDEKLLQTRPPLSWRSSPAWPLLSVLALFFFMLELSLRYAPAWLGAFKWPRSNANL